MDINASKDDHAQEGAAPSAGIGESKLHDLFQLDRVLTQDASGTLYEARKTVKGRRVAVALLAPGFTIISKRLLAIEHANICKAHQIIKRMDGTEAVVMDLPAGIPLNTLIHTGAIFSINQAITLLLQLLSAMHAVHKKGETLSSLTENNVFIAEDEKGSLHLKLVNCGVGAGNSDFRSPYYLSPEQIVDDAMRSPKSDIWAAGAVMFHLLFGRPPFDGDHAYDIAQKVMLEDPDYEDNARKLPAPLLELLKRLLNKDTEKRFQTVPDIVGELLPLKALYSDTAMPPFATNLALAVTEPPEAPFAAATPDPVENITAEEERPEVVTGAETPAAFAIAPAKDRSSPALDKTVFATDIDELPIPDAVKGPLSTVPANDTDDTDDDRRPTSQLRDHAVTRAETPRANGTPTTDLRKPTEDDEADTRTLINTEKRSAEEMDHTKIDDLAPASHDIPLSMDALATKLKQTGLTPGPGPKEASTPRSPFRAFLTEQPKLILALLAFTFASLSFTVVLVSLLRNQQMAAAARKAAHAENSTSESPSGQGRSNAANQRVQKKPSPAPPLVTVDLLRLPAGATVYVNDEPTTPPITLPKSKTAIKLTVRADRFVTFERLIVPDQDRKVLVEMSLRPRK